MLTVAQIILEQLGGGRFTAMTGAKSFVGGPDSLQFSIPKSKDKINKVRIILTPQDTYKVQFYNVVASKGLCDLVHECNDIYADNLPSIFTTFTGLYTRL